MLSLSAPSPSVHAGVEVTRFAESYLSAIKASNADAWPAWTDATPYTLADDDEPGYPDPDDAAWWAANGNQEGGTVEGEPDPTALEPRTASALSRFLDECGEDYAALTRYEAGYCDC